MVHADITTLFSALTTSIDMDSERDDARLQGCRPEALSDGFACVPVPHHVSSELPGALDVDARDRHPSRTIHSIPPEVLGEIFMQLHLLPDEELDSANPHFAQAAALFTVSCVCREWWSVARWTPTLWSRNIEFSFDKVAHRGPNAGRINEPWIRYLHLHLKRAAASPLSIYATRLVFDAAWEGSHGERALRMLLKALPKCKAFYLWLGQLEGTSDAEKRLPLKFQVETPLLEEFGLIAPAPSDATIRYRSRGRGTFLPVAPRLKRLFLYYPMPRYITWTFFPALELLQFQGRLTDSRRADVFHILQACETTTALMIQATDDRSIKPLKYLHALSQCALTFPNLTHLADPSEHAKTFGQFVPLLAPRCPNLRLFQLKAYMGYAVQLSSMAELANITTLEIGVFQEPRERARGILPPLLRLLPVLEELWYTDVRFSAEDFIPLCQPDLRTGTWIAPRLRRIRCKRIVLIHGHDWVRTVWQLVQFVKIRSSSAAEPGSSLWPLRAFDIGEQCKERPPMPKWLLAVIDRLLRKVPRESNVLE